MSGIKYSFTGQVQDYERVREVTDEIAKDANEEEKRLLDAVGNFADEVFGDVFATEAEGKFSIEVAGHAKHDGAALQITIALRKTVLPHQNALDGSAAAFPPTASEQRRKEERINQTRDPNQGAPLPSTRPAAGDDREQGRLKGKGKEEQKDREPVR